VDRDIYNARALIRRERLDGCTATVTTLKDFNDAGIHYRVKWVDEEKKDELVGLLFSYLTLLGMVKESWEVL